MSSWQSIRPWSPRLALSIREITSVSVTFILASSINGDQDTSLPSVPFVPHDDDDNDEPDDDDDDDDDDPFMDSKKHGVLSDALANGFTINVNAVPWQRVLIRIDDKTDEAVIIIYGLMPGRQYDVELDLVQAGQNSCIRKHVITEDSSKAITGQDHNRDSPPDSISSSVSLPPTSPTRSMPSTSQSSPALCDPGSTPLTIEERLQQLQADLALVNTDRDNLTASLKSSRRDAQKADAALRSEIDVLKRASEKHTAAEHRSRQKILALQEAVKRAQAATKEVEGLVRDVEAALPALRQQKDEKEMEYSRIKEEAERAQREWDKDAEKDKKRIETVTGELTALCNKLDKLNSKKEKLESSVISDLEEQLREIDREMQQIEADSSPHSEENLGFDRDLIEASILGFSDETIGAGVPHASPYSHLPVQRQRHHSQHSLGAIARPAIAPIQRPSLASTNPPQQPWSLSRPTIQHSRPAVVPLQPPQSPTLHRSPAVVPAKAAAAAQAGGAAQMPLPFTASGTTTSPGPIAAVVASPAMSTLSSRAPAFEPGASQTLWSSSGVETNAGPSYSVPIHRPRASFSNTSRPVRPGNAK